MSDSLEIAINKLNPQQREAVETIDGPVLIVAGPGTGKTQVLALRIANILRKTDIRPGNILCLTFTESGVHAMRKRLQRYIGTAAYFIKIHTFHSFCNEIIQAFPEKFAFAKELNQLDDLNRIKIIQEITNSFTDESENKLLHLKPFHDPYFYKGSIINSIQTLKREGITPDKFKEIVINNLDEVVANPNINKRTGKPTKDWSDKLKSAEKNQDLSLIYQIYNETLKERGFYDYEDMLLFVIEKFKTDDELLAHYQEKFLYLLVDEYQDTNGAQNEILRQLGSFDPSPNVFAVGDDDQAIYRFQGANLENILFFEKQFKNVKTLLITTNYRSSQNILDLAGSLIDKNATRLTKVIPGLNKKLKAGVDISNNKAAIYEFDDSENELYFIAQKIKELNGNGVKFSDIAVFYRKHSDAEDIVESLIKNNIPTRLMAGSNILNEKVIQQFIDLLRLIQFTDLNVESVLAKVLFYQFINIDRLDAFKVLDYINKKNSIYDPNIKTKVKIWDVINSAASLAEANVSEVEKFIKLANNIIKWKADSENMSLVHFFETVSTESGFISYIFETKDQVSIDDINAVNSFYQYVKELNRNNKKINLYDFLNDLELIEENGIAISEKEMDPAHDAVNLMTAHKSKGLEYRFVFIVKCYDKNWGNNKRGDLIKLPNLNQEINLNLEDVDLENEDERRLFYVALTRAQEQIFITYSKTYPSGNTTKEVTPSQFISELDENLITYNSTADYEKVDPERIKGNFNILQKPYNDNERIFLKKAVEDFKMSASALNDYLECPLKFKYTRLLRIPIEYNKNLAMGTSIHAALEYYFRDLKNETKNELEKVLFVYEKTLERKFLSVNDFSITLNEGKEILTKYFDFYGKDMIAPCEVEFGFYRKEIMLVREEGDPICLTGKIDKIEWVDKKSMTVKVVDYKTMVPKSENEVKGLTKNSDGNIFRQLVFYKILAECDDSFKPFQGAQKYNIEELEVDFLKPKSNGEFKKLKVDVNDNDVAEVKNKIFEIYDRIQNLEFFDSPEHPLCGECEWCSL
jgi:DNA helicase-2/ATP-dependent DNA helicase PcrA